MRYELTDHEWTAIKPFLPNNPRGVPRVNDRRVLNGIFLGLEVRRAMARSVLQKLMDASALSHPSPFVCSTERASYTVAQSVVNMFARWYQAIMMTGCSSHSGRRTFITNAARKISTVGGSVRDVQLLAGHSNMRTTQQYIDANGEAQKRVVDLV